MSKILKYVLPAAALALPMLAPVAMAGIGTALGAGAGSAGMLGSGVTSGLLSGIGSAVQGKGIGSSLLSAGLGGAGGALAGGGAGELANAAGLTGTASNVAQGALTGAAYGGSTGGGGGALSGALLGGIGKGITGALSGGDTLSSTGNAPMTAVSSTGAPYTTTANLQALTGGSGVSAGGGASSLGGNMNLYDAMKLGGTLYSGISSQNAYDKMQKQMSSAMSPYTTAGAKATTQLSDALSKGFNYADYANTPAYKQQLLEGQNALTSSLAAQGMGQSGAATKAATEYATNLANQNYGDAYSRWLQNNQQLAGLTGAGAAAASNLGTNNALLTGAGQQSLNEMGSGISQNALIQALLKGSGMFS